MIGDPLQLKWLNYWLNYSHRIIAPFYTVPVEVNSIYRTVKLKLEDIIYRQKFYTFTFLTSSSKIALTVYFTYMYSSFEQYKYIGHIRTIFEIKLYKSFRYYHLNKTEWNRIFYLSMILIHNKCSPRLEWFTLLPISDSMATLF